MKKLITILLIGIMLTQAFSKFLLVMEYQINKDFISAVLCINKSKPELHCNGQCYLKSKLKKAEDAEKQSPDQNSKPEIVLFFQLFFRLGFVADYCQVTYFNPKPSLYQLTTYGSPFHPPQVIT